ncbi:unnamed protein product [Cyclocybe aegerita]|uniref:DNA 3'-5' helicase n=1 Tax=Cyclocybe aegerita TaxID=1973307 RepID=A0A8S0XQS6_CYCAE|nr:unnamed protein product [Cyclocybe aegerita]
MPLFACLECNTGFNSRQAFSTHIDSCSASVDVLYNGCIIVVNREMGGFRCCCTVTTCPQYFSTSRSLKVHAQVTGASWRREGAVEDPMPMDIDRQERTSHLQIPINSDIRANVLLSQSDQLSEEDGDKDPPSLSQADFLGTRTDDEYYALVEDPDLLPLGIYIQPVLRTCICLSCQIALTHKTLASHLHLEHKHVRKSISTEMLARVAAKYELLTCLPVVEGPIPQLDGLAVLARAKCPSCDKIYAPTSMRAHYYRNHHSLSAPKTSTLEIVSAQQLNKGNNSALFEVFPRSPPPQLNSNESIIKRLREERDAAVYGYRPPNLDARVVSPWLLATQWHEHVQEFDIEELRELVAGVPRTRDHLSNLRPALLLFFHSAWDLIPTIDLLVLQRLNTNDPVKDGINNAPFKRHQLDQTLEEYSNTCARLLAMLLRPKSTYEIPLPQSIEAALATLSSALDADDISHTSDAVYRLLYRLWTCTWSKTEANTLGDPTMCFLALSALKSDGTFANPELTTHLIAHLEYCMRLVYLYSIESTRVNEKVTPQAACDKYAIWFTEKRESTFNSLRSLMHLAAGFIFNEVSMLRIAWVDRDTFRTMRYYGDLVSFDDFHTMFSRMEKDAIEMWEGGVLMGLTLSVRYGPLADDLSNTSYGYSFLSDARNKCFSKRDTLMNAILGDPTLRAEFIHHDSNEDGSPRWNRIRLQQWMYTYSLFDGLILSSVEMKSGSPGRGTELTSVETRNTRTRKRGLYMIGNHLALVRQYHKSGSITGKDKIIPQSLDAVTSDLIIQNLSIARPFAELAAYICHPDDHNIQGRYNSCLFINNKELFTTQQLTELMKKFTRRECDVPLGVHDWRHVSTAFRRKICPALEQLVEKDSEDTIGALQAGHSRRTENKIYGISTDRLVGPAEDILPLFLDASTDWQVANKITPGGHLLPYREAIAERFPELAQQGRIKSHFTGPHARTEKLVKEVSEAFEEKLSAHSKELIVMLRPMLKEMVEQAVKEAMQTAQAPTATFKSPPLPRRLSLSEQANLIPRQGSVYGTPLAKPLSQDAGRSSFSDLQRPIVSPPRPARAHPPISEDLQTEEDDNVNMDAPYNEHMSEQMTASLILGVDPQPSNDLPASFYTDRGKRLVNVLSDKSHFKRHSLEPMNTGNVKMHATRNEDRPQSHSGPMPREALSSSRGTIARSQVDFSIPASVDPTREMDALRLLQKLTKKPLATWNSPEQWLGIQHILARQNDLLIIMATGSGKTMVALIPTLLDQSVSVFVLPLNSLIMDYRRRLDGMGVQYDQYDSSTRSLRQDVNVVLVSADYAVTDRWKQAITNLNDAHTVSRLFFDEAHIPLSGQDYRRALTNLPRLRHLGVQIVLLSGSVPPGSEMYLSDLFGLHPTCRLTLRTLTDRSELMYVRLPRQEKFRDAAALLERYLNPMLDDSEPEDRFLIFVPLKVVGEDLKKRLGCDFYNGDLRDPRERTAIYNRWWNGEHPVLIATQALGAGNDYQHVRAVFHMGSPREMMNYIQEVSRAGRDGRPAKCYCIPMAHFKAPDGGLSDHVGARAMWDFLWACEDCSRFAITHYADGIGTYCSDVEHSELCSRCSLVKSMNATLQYSLGGPPSHHPWPTVVIPVLEDRQIPGTNKRKAPSGPPVDPFTEQVLRAKRDRFDKDEALESYVLRFKNTLTMLCQPCAYCRIIGEGRTSHDLRHCGPMHAVWNDYKAFQREITYAVGNLHRGVCFTCHVPQCNDRLHKPFRSVEGSECEWPDILCPTAYGIFRSSNLRVDAEIYFDVEWETRRDFTAWLSGKPVPGQETNMSALFLCVAVLCASKKFMSSVL